MRILISGDWHLRNGGPEQRLDDYEKTQEHKVNWIFNKAAELGCSHIIQPGDLTEYAPYPRMNYERVKKYINIFSHWKRKANIDLITIHGQHDTPNHQQQDNTPIAVLAEANVITILPENTDWGYGLVGADFYGCSYGKEIPLPIKSERFKILVIHKMISDQDYWDGHVPYASVEWMLEKYREYDLIISGDNHKSFHWFGQDTKRGLINCGSLMRSTIAQGDHKPHVWIFDTATYSARQYDIPIQPFNEVYDMKEIKEVKLRREESEVFVTRLEQGIDATELDFPKNLRVAMQRQEPGVNALIEEAM
jgi:hypothetical protein